MRLNEFAERLSGNTHAATLNPNSTDNSSITNNESSMHDSTKNVVLDFCQEF